MPLRSFCAFLRGPQHLIEYMENTVDVQHFTPMHGGMSIPWTSIQIPGISVLFDSQVVLGADAEAKALGPFPDHPEYVEFVVAR